MSNPLINLIKEKMIFNIYYIQLISMSTSYVMVLQSMGMHKESHEKHNSHV